ncbi:MAG: PaaI family thioesterase [Alphaproteobacteria bacterium]|nr:PaaI family thioesterase [Alphaproteobacteria bacterium]MBO6628542.1 PaaI family thioesterase [Alphaproteobacteria bacterium]MDF1626762.1 PaaI family thioesterase [Parvibaculaceae bacterium]|tara:strand:- start:356 stop:799 length:444 start_codon:yes stop_codon:yes gene_type:complete
MTDDLLEENVTPIPDGYTQMNWHSGFGRQIGPLYERDGDKTTYTRAFRVAEYHTNGMGNCHGGMLMAFADVAFGHCVTVALHRYWVTVRLLTDFMSAARLGDWVEGSGEIVGDEGGFISVKGRIWAGERTLMTGTGVFKALGERPNP